MVAPLPFGQKTRRTGATGPRLARWQSSGALPTIVQSMEALQSLVSWDRSNQRYDDAPAAEGVMRSAFGYGGQKCSACSRVYIERGVADKFVELLLEKTAKLTIGDPTKRDVYLGPVISADAATQFQHAAAKARKDGNVLTGGERLGGEPFDRGNFVEPTIAELPLDHEIFRNELFLPFLALARVDSFDQALAESNRVPLGLTGGLFSKDDAQIDRFFDEMQAGVLYVNRRTGATTGAWPGVQSFCGWKGSGITGKGGCGPFYVQQYMREQSRTRMM